MIVGVLFLTLSTFAGFAPPSINKNNAGVEKYKVEDYSGAIQDFATALGKDTFKPEFRFNLAEGFAKSGEPDKALAEFDIVAKDPQASPELKFQSLFNAGNVAVEKKDIPKALSFYQRALEIKPDSVETKTNIELALANGGGGGGDGQQKKDSKDGKGQNQKQKQENDKDGKDKERDQESQGQPKQNPKPKPKPFKSQALSESEVRQILEELKRQEERIRLHHDKTRTDKSQENGPQKDW